MRTGPPDKEVIFQKRGPECCLHGSIIVALVISKEIDVASRFFATVHIRFIAYLNYFASAEYV